MKIISIARLRTRRAAFAAVLVSAAVALPLAFVPASGAAASIAAGPRPTIVLGSSNLILVPYPGAPAGVKDAYLKPGVFGSCLANGLPASQARALAATQRPLSTAAFTQPAGVPAWKTIRSWAVIGTADHAIPPAEQLTMMKAAHAHITEIHAPHLSMIADPGAVTKVILQAVHATT